MRNRKTCFLTGGTFIALFALLTLLIMTIDVQPVGQNGTNIGFATFNTGFHALTGANMTLYTITDWLGLAICDENTDEIERAKSLGFTPSHQDDT